MENKISIYKTGIILKFNRNTDRFEIFNKLRAIQDVIIVTPKDIKELDRRMTDSIEYGFVTIKFLASTTPIDAIKQIEIAAIKGHETAKKINGLLAMYYNINKIETL